MHFRYARHTNRLHELVDFYINFLGLNFLGEFQDHSGYDGVFIGKENSDWHLEFTQTKDLVVHQFDEDDLLVFYPESQSEYDALIRKVNSRKELLLKPKNPYWAENGITLGDPDGYRIVISPLKIKK